MGLPLGPTFVNIFMCHWEKLWFSDCPQLFTPVFYKRYVDDTLLFKERAHAQSFLHYLNFKHSNTKFTMDPEKNGRISYLRKLFYF